MIRPIQLPNDTSALFACWNAAAHFDVLPESVFLDKLHDPGFDPALGWVHEDANKVDGFAIAVLRESKSGITGHLKFLAVEPAYRRRGIGKALLERVLFSLESLGVQRIRVAEAAPNYLTPGLDVRYTPALFLLERRGFVKAGEAFNMAVEIPKEGYPDRAIDGFEIRRATGKDRVALLAFLDGMWESWKSEIELSLSRSPIAVHVALAQDQLVAFSAYEGNNAGLGTFGPMGTAPETRGLGLGEILLKRCLTDLGKLGFRRVTIPWVAPVGFYSSAVNASISRVFLRLERVK